jgi:hypothetical protein
MFRFPSDKIYIIIWILADEKRNILLLSTLLFYGLIFEKFTATQFASHRGKWGYVEHGAKWNIKF